MGFSMLLNQDENKLTQCEIENKLKELYEDLRYYQEFIQKIQIEMYKYKKLCNHPKKTICEFPTTYICDICGGNVK